jgi:hypothetical protein
MNLTVQIPDDIAHQLSVARGDLSRRALEALALHEYKTGHLTRAQLRRTLGFGTRYELDGFLKSRGVLDDYSLEDIQREIKNLESLGL